ncbi:hypothetical protein OMW55_08525 [Sphingomonas sp. BN140010]|uniref:Glycosyltransferase RgtA/B/C/D-like domain-containing protein n=1 Tax=Sphingomonas arvum TaxID=2992113 RepID=A0ABT3JFL5_9SPHN|nr:hypothetical protein [Sphingomonas sp. BN140010]MCW3797847.1 hypothetical protein [Sphingomonas sp. BN140010]
MDRPARALIDQQEAAGWWQSRAIATALVLLCAVPFVWPALPPLVDLPAHMARYQVALHLEDSAELRRFFGYHWALMGNLGVDLLVQPLARLVGLEPAVKLIVVAIPALTAAGMLAIARTAHGRVPATAFLALPFALSAPLLFGFVNFALAAGLALAVFAAWLQRRSPLLLLVAGPILFVVHLYGWAMLGVTTMGAVLGSAYAERQPLRMVLPQLSAAILPLAPVLLFLLLGPHGSGGLLAEAWFDVPQKLGWLMGALRDRWALLDMAPVIAAVLAIALARVRRLGFDPALGGAAALLGLAALLLPYKLMGSAYADMRLFPFALALGVLAIRTERLGPSAAARVAVAALACAGLRVGTVTASNLLAASEQQRLLTALTVLPRGARLAVLVGQPCDNRWALQRHAHLGAMATVRRDGFSNDQWAASGLNLLERRYQPPGRFAADPSQLVQPATCVLTWSVDQALAEVPSDAFDYLWLIGTEPSDPRLLAGFVPVWRSQGAILYRLPRR